jgi:phosphoglycerate dehydrogenase-like enzyme
MMKLIKLAIGGKNMKIAIYTTSNPAPILTGLPADLKERVELIHVRSREDLACHASEAEALVSTVKLDKEMLLSLPQLRWIQVLSAGVDSLPLDYLREQRILLTNARGIHQIQMSEFAMLMMLQWARRADLHFLNQMDKVWGKRVPSGELYGQTVGILGSGSIGQAIAAKAAAFGMRTLGYNKSGKPAPGFDETAGGPEGLQYVLAESDYVIMLLPSTPKTQHFLKMEQFKTMKPSACFINLARGSVVHEAELIEALRGGIIAGAALDVFEEEPLPPESPLWELPNVILTPHVAGASPHYMTRAAHIVFQNIRLYLEGKGEGMINGIPLNKGY